MTTETTKGEKLVRIKMEQITGEGILKFSKVINLSAAAYIIRFIATIFSTSRKNSKEMKYDQQRQ
jgi:hypothetical protein